MGSLFCLHDFFNVKVDEHMTAIDGFIDLIDLNIFYYINTDTKCLNTISYNLQVSHPLIKSYRVGKYYWNKQEQNPNF